MTSNPYKNFYVRLQNKKLYSRVNEMNQIYGKKNDKKTYMNDCILEKRK